MKTVTNRFKNFIKNFFKGDNHMANFTLEDLERRITVCEENINELYGKINSTSQDLVSTTTTLNCVLSSIGELKASVDALKQRPANMWDKVMYAVIGAIVSAIIAMVVV